MNAADTVSTIAAVVCGVGAVTFWVWGERKWAMVMVALTVFNVAMVVFTP